MTGAGRGIGLGIARALARRDSRSPSADIDGDSAAASAAELGGRGMRRLGLTLDVTRADDWARAVDAVRGRWGGLDVLVNNAGISPRGTIEIDRRGALGPDAGGEPEGAPGSGSRRRCPCLRQRRGTIVNIGSTRATRPMPGLFPYVISKAGLLGLTRQVAVECLSRGITCNMVAPGWVDTPGERLIQAALRPARFPRRASAT